MKFSIIVPAYKSEKFISRCLDSLVSQDFPAEEFEIIVIDDCSPDKQNDIINSYTKIYPFIRLIKHTQNKRQGGARNTGVAAAKGQWIMFVDSDDFWCDKMVLKTFSHIIDHNNDADIIDSTAHIDVYDSNHKFEKIYHPESFEVLTGVNYFLSNYYSWYVWRSVYRKDYLSKFKFRENVFFEDGDYRIQTILNANKIIHVEYPFYAYVNNPESTIRSRNDEVFFANIDVNNLIMQIILAHENFNVRNKGLNLIKSNVLSFLKRSKDYPITTSCKVLEHARKLNMLETSNYQLTTIETLLLFAMKYFPLIMVSTIKFGVLARRRIRNLFRYRP